MNFVWFDYESSDSRVNHGQVCEASFILTDDRFKILEFQEEKGLKLSKNELIDKRAYLKSHNPFFDNITNIKI